MLYRKFPFTIIPFANSIIVDQEKIQYYKDTSQEIVDILSAMLRHSKDERASVDQVLKMIEMAFDEQKWTYLTNDKMGSTLNDDIIDSPIEDSIDKKEVFQKDVKKDKINIDSGILYNNSMSLKSMEYIDDLADQNNLMTKTLDNNHNSNADTQKIDIESENNTFLNSSDIKSISSISYDSESSIINVDNLYIWWIIAISVFIPIVYFIYLCLSSKYRNGVVVEAPEVVVS